MQHAIDITQEALREIAAAVSGYPGRKNLYWLADRFPLYGGPTLEIHELSAAITGSNALRSAPIPGVMSTQDIAEVNVVKGGARAIDFNRAGGFNIDSVSKSGTNRLTGQVGYRFQSHSMSAKLQNGSASRYDKNRSWTDLSVGGPVLPSKVFFYGSYYRPTENRRNASTAYGSVPDYDSARNEGFGKVTVAPTKAASRTVPRLPAR